MAATLNSMDEYADALDAISRAMKVLQRECVVHAQVTPMR